jgi:HEAT repeat protein
VENYAQTLKTDQNSTLRLAAIEALHAIDPEAHRELLMDAVLTDPVPEVRKAAIHFLSQGELTHQVCSTMEQALKDPAFEVQIEAAMGLGQSGNSAHNRALLSSLSTSEMSLHQALIQALVYNNRAHLLAFIDELMGYNDVQILCGGAEVLGTIGDPRSIGLLNVWLHAKMPPLRVAAARALGAIETLEAKEALMGGVSDINEEVRLVICEALTKIPGSDTLQALVGLCRDPSSRVRAALAQSIGRSRNTASLHLAETLCKDPEESIRVEALISLLMLRDVDALERFLKQLDLQPEAVRFSLSQTDPDHPAIHMVRELARADHRPAARIAALKALPCLGQRPLEVLLDAFFDPVPEVRIVAIEISAPLKDQTAMKRAIDRLLRDPEKQVRDAVRKLNISVMDAGS